MMKWIMIICISALCAGYYLEFVEHLQPCLLCVAQRVAFFLTAVLAGLYCWLERNKCMRIMLRIGMLLTTAAGLFFAGKQVYLESLPIELRPSCSIPFESLVRDQKWLDAFLQLIQGTSDCGTVQWMFLNMSLAFWSGCIFLVLMVLVLRK